ncbi:MAG: hypothetical protein ACRDA7_01290 [Metamycoplasmataceae bacterium]
MSDINDIKKKEKEVKERSLIFGNGVSIRFSEKFLLKNKEKNEYSWEMIAKKFLSGIDDTIKYRNTHSVLNRITKEEFNNYIFKKNIKEINEGFLWDIFKEFVLNNIENKTLIKGELTDYGFSNKMEIWNIVVKILKKDKEQLSFSTFVGCFFIAYQAMMYALARSICINYDRTEYIKIKYSKNWIKKMNKYKSVYTTNYFVGTNKEMNKVIFLHGKFELINKISLNNPPLKAKNIIPNEFKNVEVSNILFGKNYEDKIILNSMLNWFWNPDSLKRCEIKNKDENIEGEIFDIVGLSSEGDKDFFKTLIMKGKTINIFWHLKEDKKDWTDFIKEFKIKNNIKGKIGKSIDSQKINIIQDTLFEGFKED